VGGRRWQTATGRIDWVRTLVAKGRQRLTPQHLRHRQEPMRQPVLHLIVLDNSGSMRRTGALAQAKSIASALIAQAKRQGDDVALLTFGGQGVQLLLPPQTARLAAVARICALGGGGGTPMADCMKQAQRLLQTWQPHRQGGQTALWLLTDGRSVQSPQRPPLATHAVIVDFEDPLHPVGRCAQWSEAWGAVHWQPAQCPLSRASFLARQARYSPRMPA
jgi:magnesium chelatase subunit ChlD-like protein